MSERAAPPTQPRVARPSSSQGFPWYDSHWLSSYERAKNILARARPEKLAEFVAAMQVFRTREDFRPVLFERLFDADAMVQIRALTASLAREQLELHEAGTFKRFVVHDLPFFDELQSRVVSLASEAAGEPLDPSYNFLSLYGPAGVCPLHLDAPEAKWTLDLCIDQSAPWPIYFSQPRAWPEPDSGGWAGNADWAAAIKSDTANQFTPHTLMPGQAILFSGSSQWHYRDVMPHTPGRRFCDLLFFHFVPRGTKALVKPANWARLFEVPELEAVEVAGDGQ